MLTLIVVFALALHAVIEALRREMLARVGGWLEERLQAPVLTAAVQAALRADPAGAAQAWRDLGTLRQFFGGSACTALFDLPWTPIFLLAMALVHPMLGVIGIVASCILFSLAWVNETVTRDSLRTGRGGLVGEPASVRVAHAQRRGDHRHGHAARRRAPVVR